MATVGWRRRGLRALTFALGVVFVASVLPAGAAAPAPGAPNAKSRPIVRSAVRTHVSPRLKDIKPTTTVKGLSVAPAAKLRNADSGEATRTHLLDKAKNAKTKGRFGPSGSPGVPPRVAPRVPGAPAPRMPAPSVGFEGVPNVDFVLPPDTNGDVGPNHYMQWVNLSFGIWDKAGHQLVGPLPGNALFEGLGGDCETHNDGDPIVLYDQAADRWLASQFALFGSDGGHHQCIAISQTGDPTGAWFQYDFLISDTKVNDYPKFGVWPDAYYMSVNLFDEVTFGFAGAGAAAFERDRMLTGDPGARMVFFDLFAVDPRFGGQLPADLDGLVPPPAGAPGIFLEADDDAFGFASDRLSMWQFDVDWSNPSSSTFGVDGQPNAFLNTTPFEMELCGFAPCIPQPDTVQRLDTLADRLMHRLQYRNFGTHQALVVDHTVDVDGTDHAGVRWYELRSTGFGWSIFQQGDHSPDAASRWMGSAAMDGSGNIAVGYSLSSSSIFPSLAAAGRLVGDPDGVLSQPERVLKAGAGSQLHPLARWGDYSMLAVDPVDDCTFWFTSEYLEATSDADWHTWVSAFKFPSCTTGPRGTIEGNVTDSATGDPIARAMVQVGESSTTTDNAGHYRILLPTGTYDVTASAYGFRPETATGVVVGDGTVATRDFSLDPLPQVVVSGTVRDGHHHWPLYARIAVGGAPIAPIYTNPATGTYAVTLFQETPYTLHVDALVGTYNPASRAVEYTTATATEDFDLTVDPTRCLAPGYRVDIAGLSESFPTNSKPDEWLNIDNIPSGGGSTWRFDDPAGRGNLTGGDGPFAIIDSDLLGPGVRQNTELRTPIVDLTGITAPRVIFRTDYFHFNPNDGDIGPEVADVDLSINAGRNWTNIWHETTSRRGPRLVDIPIPAAAGQDDVVVRFHYYNAEFEWWWQLDDIVIGTRECVPVTDVGVVLGHVRDGNTGLALNGATVTGGTSGTTATTVATPDDPAVDDGLYVLASPVGDQAFTASKADYADDVETVSVASGAATVQDFELAAGQLSGSPNPIVSANIPIGGSDDKPLTLHNTGGAGLDFEIRERDAGREILAPRGAPLQVLKGNFRPYRLHPGKDTTGRPRKVIRPAAPPWIDVADYPFPVMDNTADAFEGTVYSVSGIDGSSGDLTNRAFAYDLASNTWTEIASLSFYREKPAAAFVEDKLYVVGGWALPDFLPSPVLEIYDPATDTWTTGPDSPAAYAASTAVSLDGNLYVIGGCNDFTCGTTDVTVFDPVAASWSFAAPYPEEISWASCAAIDGRIYCAGGVSDANGESSNAYSYDPATGAWSPIAGLPITLWASGFVGADGQLIVSGGVTDNFATITNRGFAYDPAADAWTDAPGSNNTVYRGASACGFLKAGGSIGGFDPIPAVELLPGLEDCGSGVDVAWLSVTPTAGSIAAGTTLPATVHFDANVPEVDQPGTYRAQLTFRENTPYATPPVFVEMHITVPTGWGKLAGTVSGLERCDAAGGPLGGATVLVDDADADTDPDFTLRTAADGTFGVWMPGASGLTLTVSKAGYVAEERGGVAVPSNGTIHGEDFALRLDAPCATLSPESIDVTLTEGASATRNLDFGNAGGAHGYDFSIVETPFDFGPLAPALPSTRVYKKPAAVGPLSVRGPGRPAAGPSPLAPPFGPAPHPEGAVRYAHAQCDGDPDRFYVIGGVNSFFSITAANYRFDAATNTWTRLADIPQGSEGATGVCHAGRIYVIGGDGTDMNWVYDIASDSWLAGAPAPRGVAGASAAAWGRRVYLAGGTPNFDPSGATDEVDIYDIPTNSWTVATARMAAKAAFPGYAQAARYLYVVGGYEPTGGFNANSTATQRLDLATGTWTSGPALGTGRADLALAATGAALYAMGGDTSGGSIFDVSNVVERLPTAPWPAGPWASFASLPVRLTANSAGFCTTAFDGGEVWSVGGFDGNAITGYNLAAATPGEGCPSIRADVPWLSVVPADGSVGPDGSAVAEVRLNAAGLTPGTYSATLLVTTSDPVARTFDVPVHLVVQQAKAWISVADRGTVGGVAAADEDVIEITLSSGAGAMVFDGSDVGVASRAIDGLARLGDGSLLLSFTEAGTVPGVGSVDDSDIVRFVPTSLGPTTAGSFSMWFDGSDVGLTTNSEDVDAIDVVGSTLYISTVGNVSVPGVGGTSDDSDILAIALSSTGPTTAGTWSLYADMSDVGLSTDAEDVDALAVVPTNVLHVSTTGNLRAPGVSAFNDDVATIALSATGGSTAGTWNPVLFLDGSRSGIRRNDLTAVEIP